MDVVRTCQCHAFKCEDHLVPDEGTIMDQMNTLMDVPTSLSVPGDQVNLILVKLMQDANARADRAEL